MRPLRRFLSWEFACLIVILMMAGCNEINVASLWRARTISIDGSDSDWSDMLMYFKDANISLGLCNDEHDLYLCFITTDPTTERQIVGSGFTVWIDSTGGSQKTFGIHFPLGFRASREEQAQRGTEEDNPEFAGPLLQRMTSELELLGPGKDDKVRMAAPGSGGVLVQLSRSADRFVYELKVPLSRTPDDRFAVGAGAAKAIGLGLEVTPPGSNRRTMADGEGQEGRGRGGRRFGGGSRSERPASDVRGSSQPLDLWMKVALATKAGITRL